MRVAFLFPGQGSQSIGMGKDFFDSNKEVQDIVDSASSAVGFDFTKLMFENNSNLSKTEFTQPAIFLVSAIANRLLTSSIDIRPEFLLGHSLGEFSALNSSGALGIDDGVVLTNRRGQLMSRACEGKDAGMMVLLGLSDEKVEEICQKARGEGKQVWAANYNSDGQIVAAGLKSDLASLELTFKESGAKRAMLLDMSVASHCPLLQSASEELSGDLDKFIDDKFNSPVISNANALAYSTKKEAITLLQDQLVKPVLYKQSILKYSNKVDLFIELGGKVLKGINKKIIKTPTHSIFDMKSLDETLKELRD
jgi:[acyl-carrier-protein] S-malonyltransferase